MSHVHARAQLSDIKTWVEPVVFMLLSALFPTIRIWPDSTARYVKHRHWCLGSKCVPYAFELRVHAPQKSVWSCFLVDVAKSSHGLLAESAAVPTAQRLHACPFCSLRAVHTHMRSAVIEWLHETLQLFGLSSSTALQYYL
jgi:hypothetical protein